LVAVARLEAAAEHEQALRVLEVQLQHTRAELTSANATADFQRDQYKDYLVLLQQGVAEQTEATSQGLRDELRDVRAQLSDRAHENIDLQKKLHEFEVNEDTVGTADDTMDTEARLRILSDEVRTLRGTLSDLSHENADLREQLLDLEDTEKAADEAVERSTDAPPADYYRDPYEQAEAEERQIVMVQAAADAGRLAALALPLEEEVQPACGGDDHSGRDPDCAVVNGTPSSAVPVDGPRGGGRTAQSWYAKGER
jgi:hypothetical protein